jgi:hypothetical protein
MQKRKARSLERAFWCDGKNITASSRPVPSAQRTVNTRRHGKHDAGYLRFALGMVRDIQHYVLSISSYAGVVKNILEKIILLGNSGPVDR